MIGQDEKPLWERACRENVRSRVKGIYLEKLNKKGRARARATSGEKRTRKRARESFLRLFPPSFPQIKSTSRGSARTSASNELSRYQTSYLVRGRIYRSLNYRGPSLSVHLSVYLSVGLSVGNGHIRLSS